MTKKRLLLLSTILLIISTSSFGSGLVGSDSIEYDHRIERKLKKLDLKYKILKSGRFKLTYEVENKRSQVVFVNSETEEYRDFEIREIWAIAYESSKDRLPVEVANKLLEDTSTKKLGAWAKKGKLAVFVSRISAKADTESLKSTIKFVLEATDEMEKILTNGADKF